MFSIIVAASATKLQVKRLPGFSVFVVKTLIHTKKENYLQSLLAVHLLSLFYSKRKEEIGVL